jgi:hypothetical protein
MQHSITSRGGSATPDRSVCGCSPAELNPAKPGWRSSAPLVMTVTPS